MLPPELISEDAHSTIRDALRALDKRQLVLGVHGPSLPSLEEEDTGRGTPYSAGASRYFAFVRQLGFTAVQLGPMGQTSADNASPYDGALFAANVLDLWLPALVDGPLGGLLPERVAQALVSQAPPGGRSRVDHPRVFNAQRAALELAFTSFQRMRARDEAAHLPVQAVDAFAAQHRAWLEPHALYEVLCREHRAGWYREWRTSSGAPHPDQRLYAPAPGEESLQASRREQLLAGARTALDFHAFTQWVLWAQHAALRSYLQRLGLSLFGDLQVGPSPEDAWASARAFLPGYLLGAPPSRTNPEGQPWGYPVLSPDAWTTADGTPGPAQAMLRARLERMFGAYDGVRVDHPHGWVCPWVYDADALFPLQAVQHGARLFDSPALEDHPALARFALVRPDQLAPPGTTPRHADDWVRSIEPAQEDAYARAVDLMVELAQRHGRQREDLAFEVLSTQPYPLARVLARHGLGRFRVTQKADPRRPDDVYRTENARPEDWVMVGSHDTPPLAQVLQRWAADPGGLAGAGRPARAPAGAGPREARGPRQVSRGPPAPPVGGDLCGALLLPGAERLRVLHQSLRPRRALQRARHGGPGELDPARAAACRAVLRRGPGRRTRTQPPAGAGVGDEGARRGLRSRTRVAHRQAGAAGARSRALAAHALSGDGPGRAWVTHRPTGYDLRVSRGRRCCPRRTPSRRSTGPRSRPGPA